MLYYALRNTKVASGATPCVSLYVCQAVDGEPTWSKLWCYCCVVVNILYVLTEPMLANLVQESFRQGLHTEPYFLNCLHSLYYLHFSKLCDGDILIGLWINVK